MPSGKAIALFVFAAIHFVSPAQAGDFKPEDFNIILSTGRSIANWHGWDRFESTRFELAGRSERLDRHLTNSQLIAAMTYNRVQQPHSWFGFEDGEDNLRAFAFMAGVRKNWRPDARFGAYAEIGTGPVWSNRRIPAATSQINFESQLGLGFVLRTTRRPFYFGYRFSHISNGGIVKRNPGLQVNAIVAGVRAKRF